MLARVSSLETFRRWRLDESASPAQLVERLTNFEPTEAMQAGTALHAALEVAQSGDFATLEANGYTFIMPDADIAIPSVREVRASGEYGPLTVTGKFDALHGNRIEDHKTTGSFRPDGYMEGCQWRFYLDIFGCDIFRWNVFEVRADRGEPKTYHVKPPHFLEQCRYPGMHDDCMSLAHEFHEFAERFMPDYVPELEVA